MNIFNINRWNQENFSILNPSSIFFKRNSIRIANFNAQLHLSKFCVTRGGFGSCFNLPKLQFQAVCLAFDLYWILCLEILATDPKDLDVSFAPLISQKNTWRKLSFLSSVHLRGHSMALDCGLLKGTWISRFRDRV